ncbi:DUF2787 family protein [Vibrio sp. Y2-5]|uniref:DUF2787 family protein n=1 Tax=Vibrio sp. Y2-5 TaxID=2743977 RepID=UPI0016602697|nr:DUF2787 family protein [Vibrio sp. Y2-5]MBD0788007.1 DUF2787 family protein [Vibrio sp. Y2-5]
MKISNVSFLPTQRVRNFLTQFIPEEPGCYELALADGNYSIEHRGHRPCNFTIERGSDNQLTLHELVEFCGAEGECAIGGLVESNRFDFSLRACYFEFVGRLAIEAPFETEVSDVFDLFAQNIVTNYEIGSYDLVSVKKLVTGE